MGRRGPKAKPSALKKQEGTYRPDRAPAHEPHAPPGEPEMPEAVARDPLARACWERTVPLLLRMRVLSVADWMALEGLALAYATARRADDAVLEHGMLWPTEHGHKLNPAVSVRRLVWAELRKFAAEFGLTPAARTRIEAEDPGDAGRGAERPATAPESTEEFLFGGGVVGRIA